MCNVATCASYLVLPLRRGSVGGLTPAQVRALAQPDERLVSLSTVDAAAFVRPCAESHLPLARFVGLDDFVVILVPRSSLCGLHATAPSTNAGVVSDHESGRVTVTPAAWRDMTRVLQPHLAVALHDAVALGEARTSRRRRGVCARNEAWAKATRAMGDVSCTVLWPASLLLASRDATGDTSAAAATAPAAACSDDGNKAVHGEGCYVDMLPCNENSYEYACNMHHVVALCAGPTMCQANSLVAVLAALHAGVRYIESPLPWALAEKGIALTLQLHMSDSSNNNNKDDERGSDYMHGSTTTSTTVADAGEYDDDGGVLIDLNDAAYALDTRPLCADCACYTCRRHHRAYVHHLLTVYEMNSTILLALHNLARLLAVVRSHRALTSAAERAAYIAFLLAQC